MPQGPRGGETFDSVAQGLECVRAEHDIHRQTRATCLLSKCRWKQAVLRHRGVSTAHYDKDYIGQ